MGLVWFVQFYTLYSILMALTVPTVPSVLQTLVIDSPPCLLVLESALLLVLLAVLSECVRRVVAR